MNDKIDIPDAPEYIKTIGKTKYIVKLNKVEIGSSEWIEYFTIISVSKLK
jgi:hypothetical protein